MKFDVKQKIRWVTSQWSTPGKGRYVSFKEIMAYSVGGIGVQFIAAIVNNIAMSAGSLFVGSVYGLTPIEMQTIAVIGIVVSLLIIPIRGIIMDNSKSKNGKYRPIILWTAIPSTIISVAMAYIPMSATHATKVAIIGTGFVLLQIFYNQLLYIAYTNLVQVISPNSDERTAIVSFSSVVYSIAPTITGFLMPIIAEVANSSMVDIKVYRLMFPIFGVLGLILSYFAYFGTKERIIVGKSHKNKVNFWHGMKSVFSNKYLWIVNIQTIVVFARSASSIIMNWIFVYQMQDNVMMALLTTVMGTASFIGMVGAPILVKFIGKRNLIIGAHFVFAISYGLTFFFINSPAMLLVLIYLANIANSTAIITGPAINADMLDYQQWKTGERLDGFFQNFGIITQIIGIGTGYVIPFVTESYGLLQNYDVLYDDSIRGGLIKILAIISFVGGIASLIPFFFYDLTEKKHRRLIRDLERRALEEDLNAGTITEEEYNEHLNEIAEAEKMDMEKEAKREKRSHKNKKGNIEVLDSDDIVQNDICNQSGGSPMIESNVEIEKSVAQLKENIEHESINQSVIDDAVDEEDKQ